MKIARYYIAALSVIAAVSVPVVLATNVPEPPPPPEPPPAEAPPSGGIPNCEVKGSIDKTSITCPTDGSPTVVCNLELDTSNFGLDIENCCTCNVAAGQEFIECDPDYHRSGGTGRVSPRRQRSIPLRASPRRSSKVFAIRIIPASI